MLADFVRNAIAGKLLCRARFEKIPEELATALKERGYAQLTVRVYGRAAGHFLVWLARHKVPLSAVDESTTERFVAKHLPHCRCHGCGPRRDRHSVRAALRHLLTVLRATRRMPRQPSSQVRAIQRAVARFDEYLQNTCGLSPATRLYRRRYATQFLVELFGSAPIRVRELRPKQIIEFVARHAERRRPGSAQVMASSLRSFLRFEQLCGCVDRRLVTAVPCIPQWRLAALPNVLVVDHQETRISTLRPESRRVPYVAD